MTDSFLERKMTYASDARYRLEDQVEDILKRLKAVEDALVSLKAGKEKCE